MKQLGFVEVSVGGDATKGVSSLIWGELWWAPPHVAWAILKHPLLQTRFPCLEATGHQAEEGFAQSPSSPLTISVDLADFSFDLQRFRRFLRRQRTLPPRFQFAPVVAQGSPLPTYSYRRMRTGIMSAGLETCRVNRNWDGLDRIEDLVLREFFEDAGGLIRVVRQPLPVYLGREVERLHLAVERQAVEEGKKVTLTFDPAMGWADQWAASLLERAERFRDLWGLADYRLERGPEIEAILQRGITHKKNSHVSLFDLGAYWGEIMRASWGGFYRPPKPYPQRATLTEEELPEVALELPFGQRVYPWRKVLEAHQAARPRRLALYLTVLAGQNRQSQILDSLALDLYSPQLLRRRAATRILCEIHDIRVNVFLAERLRLEEESDLLVRLLERFLQSGADPPVGPLKELAQHPEDKVAARAILLLGRRRYEPLTELLPQWLKDGARIPLRIVARQALEKIGSRKARKALRSLGPIPLLEPHQVILPGGPEPPGALTLLGEILEDTASPTKRENAMQILCAIPNMNEEETLGAALADPERALRCAAVGLLSGSTRPLAQKLLQTRAFFEEDPLVRELIHEALLLIKEEQKKEASLDDDKPQER